MYAYIYIYIIIISSIIISLLFLYLNEHIRNLLGVVDEDHARELRPQQREVLGDREAEGHAGVPVERRDALVADKWGQTLMGQRIVQKDESLCQTTFVFGIRSDPNIADPFGKLLLEDFGPC